MGLAWAAGWAVMGILIGVMSNLLPGLPWNRLFDVFDAPLPALAIPGFFAGIFFSIVLGIAGRRHKFEELSLPEFAAWGAAGGFLLAVLPAALFASGLATISETGRGPLELLAIISAPFTVLGAISAVVTLLIARRAKVRDPLAALEDSLAGELPEATGDLRINNKGKQKTFTE